MDEVMIYDHFYGDVLLNDSFPSVLEAAQYTLDQLPSDDMPYMIGYSDERGILAFVFQGNIYTINR